MTLENLRGIGRIHPHNATGTGIRRLLASAEAALAALMANGFRPSTSEAGHQQTTIQTLPKTIGLPAEKMKVLDGFRRARNLSDYEGEPVEDAKVHECIEWAQTLLENVRTWIQSNQPQLL